MRVRTATSTSRFIISNYQQKKDYAHLLLHFKSEGQFVFPQDFRVS